MTSVWVVDDHAVIRQGLKQILHQETDQFKVTLEASSVTELFDLLSKNEPPGALILDLSMPGKSGLDALDELRSLYRKRFMKSFCYDFGSGVRMRSASRS